MKKKHQVPSRVPSGVTRTGVHTREHYRPPVMGVEGLKKNKLFSIYKRGFISVGRRQTPLDDVTLLLYRLKLVSPLPDSLKTKSSV